MWSLDGWGLMQTGGLMPHAVHPSCDVTGATTLTSSLSVGTSLGVTGVTTLGSTLDVTGRLGTSQVT